MSNSSRSEDAFPDPSIVAAQEAQPLTPQNVQGSAMLDAHRKANQDQPEGVPFSDPVATNFSNDPATNFPD
uniref:Uncharacterized protein n=1 Tax=Cyanothece sp. (strain PCC 7425 / ATCC 29141) TaxID=395961 RepID=B8HNX4_CYAP4